MTRRIVATGTSPASGSGGISAPDAATLTLTPQTPTVNGAVMLTPAAVVLALLLGTPGPFINPGEVTLELLVQAPAVQVGIALAPPGQVLGLHVQQPTVTTTGGGGGASGQAMGVLGLTYP